MNDSNNSAVNAGWNLQDQHYLNRDADPAGDPTIQTFTQEELEGEPEQRQYWCSVCRAKLDYLQGTETIWICSNCSQMYDTSIQDLPVKNIKYSRVGIYP